MSITVSELCQGIELQEDAVRIMAGKLPEHTYKEYKTLYEQSHLDFFQTVASREYSNAVFLSFFCRIACDVYELYEEKGIEASVFWDTFRDITYWCENCYNEFGEYGIHEYEWFWRHVDMTIFRLGRLEFEIMNAKEEVVCGDCRIKIGDPVINIHIPQGSPLIWEECETAFTRAYKWFGSARPYICHSWLLYPGLKEVLPEQSHIMQFQKHFVLLRCYEDSREAEWRIFDKVLEDTADYKENTSLQRKAKKYLLGGGKLGAGLGLYPVKKIHYPQ